MKFDPEAFLRNRAEDERRAGNDAVAERFDKCATEIHELLRTRSEAEADARVAGYKEGQRDAREAMRHSLGIPS